METEPAKARRSHLRFLRAASGLFTFVATHNNNPHSMSVFAQSYAAMAAGWGLVWALAGELVEDGGGGRGEWAARVWRAFVGAKALESARYRERKGTRLTGGENQEVHGREVRRWGRGGEEARTEVTKVRCAEPSPQSGRGYCSPSRVGPGSRRPP